MPDMFFRKFVQFGMDSIVKNATTGVNMNQIISALFKFIIIATYCYFQRIWIAGLLQSLAALLESSVQKMELLHL